MTFLDKAGYYVRYASGMNEYLRLRLSGDWEEQIRRQLENRETHWLQTIRRAIFEQPENPYHRMFELAGLSYEDLAAVVARDGLEPTLSALLRAGVYLTHDEFKGKQPIERSGVEIPSHPQSFANPLVAGGYESRSGGSRSRGTTTRKSAAFRVYSAGVTRLHAREFDLANCAVLVVSPILPSSSGFSMCIRYVRDGCRLLEWYSPGSGRVSDSAHYRVFTRFLVAMARAHRTRAPFPRHLPANDYSAPAARVAELVRTGVRCLVRSSVSGGVRVAAAAIENGLDIRGTVFVVGGEALTESKRRVIESAGGEVYASYYISEVGAIGLACRQMKTGNRVHLFSDSVAAITRRRQVPLSGAEVSSLMFTTLLPVAPNLFINAEMDDAGTVEPVECDCAFSRMGFHYQVRDISSYGKLTGQGVTLVGTQIVQILEEILPERFGGVPTDYQLVEQEGALQTELVLRVNPRLTGADPARVKEVFLHEIERFCGGAGASRLWRHSNGFEVVMAEPITTMRGKVLSLHLLGASQKETANAS